MNRRNLVRSYERATRAVSRLLHTRKLQKAAPRQIEFLVEAHVRLPQLVYLLSRFVELEDEHRRRDRELRRLRKTDPEGHHERSTTLAAIGPQLELHAEAFYLFAWRLREVLREITGFGGFDPAGVRGVRNHLIEHAHDRGGIMPRNYVFDCPQGFVLKLWGGQPGRFRDAGLYPNAQEFIRGLTVRLVAAGFDPAKAPRRPRNPRIPAIR